MSQRRPYGGFLPSHHAGDGLYCGTQIVERGLILKPYEVDSKTTEMTALPAFSQQIALKSFMFAFDVMNTQKNSQGHHQQ